MTDPVAGLTVYARDPEHAAQIRKDYGHMSVNIIIRAEVYQRAEQIPEYRRFKGIK
jgi:hypothetical protein